MAYQLLVVAPDAGAVATLVAQGAAGSPWGVAIPGSSAEAMPEDARYAAVSVPSGSRADLDAAFPGSPWRHLACGEDMLARWRAWKESPV